MKWPVMFLAGASVLLAGARICRSEDLEPGQVGDFSAVQLYPNSQQVYLRTSGTQGTQVGDTGYLVKNFKLEWFTREGRLQQYATAPECLIDQANNTASSATHLVVQSGDGKMRLEGDGFLWRQTEQSLTLSNHVSQVIDKSLAKTGLTANNASNESKP